RRSVELKLISVRRPDAFSGQDRLLPAAEAGLVAPFSSGVARFYQAKKRHVITTQTEHKCVLDSCRILEAEGFNVTYLPVQKNGLLDLKVQSDSLQIDNI
ncbi:cysteine desulfurase, partial [Xenoophorus captivus]